MNLAVDLRNGSLPFSVPELGTKASVVPLGLPVGTDGAIPRIWRVREALEEMKVRVNNLFSFLVKFLHYRKVFF